MKIMSLSVWNIASIHRKLMLQHSENPMIDTHTGVPSVRLPEITELEEIERCLEEMIRSPANTPNNASTPSPVQMPTMGGQPVNEYTMEGYIAMAFPTLFPTGAADLCDAVNRREEVKTAEYFKSLLTYKDGRFGSHPRYVCLWSRLTSRFVFFALNTKLRAEAEREAKLFIKTTPGAADLTVEELRQRLDSERKDSFLKSVRRSIDWIPGLTPFWQRHRSQLIQMIEQIGSPHLFFTLSAADLHWPQLHRIIEQQRAQSTGNDQLDLDTLDEKAR